MDTRRKVSLKALFLVTCFLKVGSSALGWVLDQPWTYGLILPLSFMLAYIFIGYRYRESEVSAEKFADSCYYLGFIFTIVSIIFSLIDIPNIGSDMTTIAVRFGAAMASTVFGLFVRVLLVSFRPSAEDALTRVEDQVVDSARRLSDEFDDTFTDLRDFRGKVSSAARETVALVDEQFETLAASHLERSSALFEEMSRLNHAALQEIVAELRSSSSTLARYVSQYEGSLKDSLGRIDASVDMFTHQLVTRLRTVEFPEDLFARKLDAPLKGLGASTDSLTAGVRQVAGDVLKAARAVDTAIGQLNLRTEGVAQMLDSLERLSNQQERLVVQMKAQQDTLAAQLHNQQEAITQGMARQNRELAAIASALDNLDGSMKRMCERTGQHSDARLARLAELTERFMNQGIERFERIDRVTQALDELQRREGLHGRRTGLDDDGRSGQRDSWTGEPSLAGRKPE